MRRSWSAGGGTTGVAAVRRPGTPAVGEAGAVEPAAGPDDSATVGCVAAAARAVARAFTDAAHPAMAATALSSLLAAAISAAAASRGGMARALHNLCFSRDRDRRRPSRAPRVAHEARVDDSRGAAPAATSERVQQAAFAVVPSLLALAARGAAAH